MSKCRIILVRHGETNWNREGRYQGQVDTDLSERGLAQGKLLATALKDVPIDEFYSSQLKRAKMTANFCAQLHGKTVKIDERFQEIAHGKWEGLLAEEVRENYAELLNLWQTKPAQVLMPEGESLELIAERSWLGINEIAQANLGKTVLLAAHDAINKVLVAKILGAPLDAFWQIKQDNTCINILEYQEQDKLWKIVLLNYTGHMGTLYSDVQQKGL